MGYDKWYTTPTLFANYARLGRELMEAPTRELLELLATAPQSGSV